MTEKRSDWSLDQKNLDKAPLLPLPTSASTTHTPAGQRKRSLLQAFAVTLLATTLVAYYLPIAGSYVFPEPSHRANVQQWKEWRETAGYRTVIQGYDYLVSAEDNAAVVTKKMPRGKAAEKVMLSVPDNESARNASHSFTAITHVAGTEGDRLSALRVKTQWEGLLGLPLTDDSTHIYDAGTLESNSALTGQRSHRHGCAGKRGGAWRKMARKVKRSLGLGGDKKWKGHLERPRVFIQTYYTLLNYPVRHSLALRTPGAEAPSFVAKLQEDVIPEDPTSAQGSIDVPTFHGFSKNGTATGKLVFAGRGTKEDFDLLRAKGIDFTGTIAIAQYSGSFRGLKVKEAAAAGCAAILIYSDPIEDGEITLENGYEVYPRGPARQPSSVQRGSAQYLSLYPGDPLTPFTPSYKNTTTRLPRDSPDLNIPTIPSLPISYEDAIPLLTSLNGKGMKMEDLGRDVPNGWKEGGLGYRGVEYWTGPGEEDVELVNIVDEKVTPIWNTMAVIPGHIKDEVVVLGNHNDAWTFGASDPNSGSATLHEIVKAFGVLGKQGWKPLRTIVLASWDAEEYGLIGSTEFGEDFADYLKKNVVAYLNVDGSAAGTGYSIKASPSLADVFRSASAAVPDPDQPSRNLLERLQAEDSTEDELKSGISVPRIGPLGSGSDFTVFLQFLGLASGNIGYERTRTDPVYHYHSIYDSAYWMDKFGDPTFSHHTAVAKVLGLVALRLADDIILPINVTAYAHELTVYVDQVRSLTKSLSEDEKSSLNLDSLSNAVAAIQVASAHLDTEIAHVRAALENIHHPKKGSKICIHKTIKHIRSINKRLKAFEGGFVTDEGLPQRKWYRSRVIAPGRDLGYGATSLPALTESLTLDHDVKAAAEEVVTLVGLFKTVAQRLEA